MEFLEPFLSQPSLTNRYPPPTVVFPDVTVWIQAPLLHARPTLINTRIVRDWILCGSNWTTNFSLFHVVNIIEP